MAGKGGKTIGAGRKPLSTRVERGQVLEAIIAKDPILIAKATELAEQGDQVMLRWCLEHLTGKALHPSEVNNIESRNKLIDAQRLGIVVNTELGKHKLLEAQRSEALLDLIQRKAPHLYQEVLAVLVGQPTARSGDKAISLVWDDGPNPDQAPDASPAPAGDSEQPPPI